MAEFLTTYGTSHNLENIILDAEHRIVLVSPYLQISKTLLERLKEAANKRIQIKIVYGKDQLKQNERKALEEIRSLELYYFDNLHAKCYFNEKTMIITSMNMYEFSEKNNREMGILIDSVTDKNLYEKAEKEVKSILSFSTQEFIKQSVVKENTKSYRKANFGFCIRCENKINYNPNAPYCQSCYNSWSHWNNYDFEEKVCHKCGQSEISTMSKPECYTCYKQHS